MPPTAHDRARYERAGRNVYAYATNLDALLAASIERYGLDGTPYRRLRAEIVENYRTARAQWAVGETVPELYRIAANLMETAEGAAFRSARELRAVADDVPALLRFLESQSWWPALRDVATGIGQTFEAVGGAASAAADAADFAGRALGFLLSPPGLILVGLAVVAWFQRDRIAAAFAAKGAAAA